MGEGEGVFLMSVFNSNVSKFSGLQEANILCNTQVPTLHKSRKFTAFLTILESSWGSFSPNRPWLWLAARNSWPSSTGAEGMGFGMRCPGVHSLGPSLISHVTLDKSLNLPKITFSIYKIGIIPVPTSSNAAVELQIWGYTA